MGGCEIGVYKIGKRYHDNRKKVKEEKDIRMV